MAPLEKLENFAAKPGRLSRRTFVGRVAKASAAIAAGLAGIAEFPGAAHAANYHCCTLAYPSNWCNSDFTAHQCPCSDTPWEWLCGENFCTWVCGECYACSCSYAYFIPCNGRCPCTPELAERARKLGLTADVKPFYRH